MESVMINSYVFLIICLSLNGYITVVVFKDSHNIEWIFWQHILNRQVNHPSHYMGYHFANRNNLHVINGFNLINSSEVFKSPIQVGCLLSKMPWLTKSWSLQIYQQFVFTLQIGLIILCKLNAIVLFTKSHALYIVTSALFILV